MLKVQWKRFIILGQIKQCLGYERIILVHDWNITVYFYPKVLLSGADPQFDFTGGHTKLLW